LKNNLLRKDLTMKKNAKSSLRMDAEHQFNFQCKPGITCFTQCCRDVTIALTPYDVVRLKRAVGLNSDEFLDKYTLTLTKENRLIPLVVLRMNEDDKKCPFVTEKGCTVYENRPWACRMFPLDMNDDGTFRIIADDSRCLGLKDSHTWQIGDWLVDQGVPIYDQMNILFSQVTGPLKAGEPDIDNPQIYKMTFMALYNLDRFRDFVFQSSFLERFHVEPVTIEKIKRSDVELMKFAFDWIKFGLLGQKTFQVKPEAVKQKDLQANEK